MLTSVTIKGFKCLRDVTVDLEPFTVLIGPNDSGKSSFLQALAGAPGVNERLKQSALAGSLSLDLRAQDGSRHWISNVHLDDLRRAGQTKGLLVLARGNILQSIVSEPPFRISVSPIVSFDAGRVAAGAPVGSGTSTQLIETRGQGTSAYLGQVALGDRDVYEAIQRALREVSGGRVREVRVSEPSPTYQLAFKLQDGALVPASEMSQGVLLYLAFLCLVHRPDRPDVMLIEEPESGLHPLRLHELVSLLRTLNDVGIQVILTTHSPDLLSACQPKEVRVFLRPEPGSPTEVHRLPAHFDAIAMRQSIGQIWASRGEAGLLDILPKATPFARAEPEPA